MKRVGLRIVLSGSLLVSLYGAVRADVIADWNEKAVNAGNTARVGNFPTASLASGTARKLPGSSCDSVLSPAPPAEPYSRAGAYTLESGPKSKRCISNTR
jgi:hypothetical protein